VVSTSLYHFNISFSAQFEYGAGGFIGCTHSHPFSSLVESQPREVFLATTTEALSFASIKSAMFRGLEYGLLGFILGYLTQRQKNTFLNHGLIGLGIGVLFGSMIVIPQLRFTAPSLDYSYSVSSPSTLAIIGQNIAELIFPVGCSLVVRMTEQPDS
jgi:hypothetical protein